MDPVQTDLLERVLVALRDRIPEKLGKESMSGKKGKAKEKVDVFRGGECLHARRRRAGRAG